MTYAPSSLGARYWRARLSRWPVFPLSAPVEGYTLLLPVPGDLPVFLRVALAVVRDQQSLYRHETFVIPDVLTPAVRAIVKQARDGWPGPLRLRPFPAPERWALPRLNNPGRNHALQLITGTAHAKTSHVILHDADLFLMQPDILDRQYAACVERRLACLGVSPVWDDWFAEHGRHLAATWELCARTDWLKSFVPALHMAHENQLFGERHAFDTTLYPQAITHPDQIGVEPTSDIVHLNYVVSNYRYFLRNSEGSFIDNRFLLLFIRLLIDVFDASERDGYRLPSLMNMGAYLGRDDTPVVFPPADEGGPYQDFRELLERILSGPWAQDGQRQEVFEDLKQFDDFYLAGFRG
jgi:hypothetical protein